jgi:asparaginyl-tRNA synthetase
MTRTLIKDALTTAAVDSDITLGGWVRAVRHSKGGFSFVQINDGSCFGQIQIVADGDLSNYADEIQPLSVGSSVLVTGKLVQSQGKGQSREVQASEVRVIGTADPETYPIQPKRHSFEFLRTQAHLRMRTNTFGAVARVRNVVCMAIHDFFQEQGFVYVHTPVITASDCEGAGEMFRVSTIDPDNPPRGEDGKVDYDKDFFGRPTYLTVSGQLEAETYSCGLGNVYTFGPTFRSENSNTPRHLAEFWMIEPEMAFCDLKGDAELAENMIKFVITRALDRCPDDMEFFNKWVEKGIIERLAHIVESDFVHLSYTEAVEILEKADKKWQFPVTWGVNLQTEHERYLTEEVYKKPVVVMDYPKRIKPFYMRVNDDGKTVAAMDVLVPGIGEIIGGSQREERLDVLLARMKELELDPETYWWYVDLRKYGSVPHAGFGLGLERCVQLCTGMENIRDVIPYPRTPRSADF